MIVHPPTPDAEPAPKNMASGMFVVVNDSNAGRLRKMTFGSLVSALDQVYHEWLRVFDERSWISCPKAT